MYKYVYVHMHVSTYLSFYYQSSTSYLPVHMITILSKRWSILQIFPFPIIKVPMFDMQIR